MAPEIKKQFITGSAKMTSVLSTCDLFSPKRHDHPNNLNPMSSFFGEWISWKLMAGLLPDLAEGFPFPMDLPDLLGGLGGTGLGGLGATPMAEGKSPPTTGEANGMKSLFGDLGTLKKSQENTMGKRRIVELLRVSVKIMLLMLFGYGRVEALCPVEFLLLLDLCWLLEVQEVWKYVIWWAS